jgi:hypothetical protein
MESISKTIPGYLRPKGINVLAVEARPTGLSNVCQLTITTLQGKYEGFFVSDVTIYSLDESKITMSFNERQII